MEKQHPIVEEMRIILTVRDESKRRTDAFALLAKIVDRIDLGEDAYITLKDFSIIPKSAWIYYNDTRYARTCRKCGTLVQRGDEVWVLNRIDADGNTKTNNIYLCVHCYHSRKLHESTRRVS